MQKGNRGMKISEVVAEVNRLEVSPSKNAGGSCTQPSPSFGGDAKTPGKKVGELKKK